MSTKIKGSCSEAGKEHNQSSQEIWMQKTCARDAGNLLVEDSDEKSLTSAEDQRL